MRIKILRNKKMKQNKKVNKRLDSAKEYMDALQEKYSKLCIVRTDYGYKKPYSNKKTFNDANADFNRLQNNRRGNDIYKHQVGFMCLKEYTEDKGVHFHLLSIHDGNKVQKDAFKGQQEGDYWVQVTKGEGSYHNCNMNEYKHNGLGMIDHTDKEKRKILDEQVISYLCKDDAKQGLESVKSNDKDRAFTRGTLPKNKSNVGRPRKT